MRLVSAVAWRAPMVGALYAISSTARCLAFGVGWTPSQSLPLHKPMLAVASAPSALHNFLPPHGSVLLLLAEIVAIAAVITGLVSLALGRDRTVHEIAKSNTVRSSVKCKPVLGAAVGIGCLALLFEVFRMVFYVGSTFWISSFIVTLLTVLLAAAMTFIVLRKEEQLHRAISANEDRYRLLFEKSLTGAYRLALDGRVLDCNVAFCQLFGYEKREEVIGKSIEFAYPNLIERTRFIEKLEAAKQLTNFEQRLQRWDGSPLWVLNSAALVAGKTGLEFEIKGTVTDISEIRKAELEHRRLAAIVSYSDDAIISCSLDGKIETWNAGAERILGFSAEQAVGRSLNDLPPGEHPSKYWQMLEKVKDGQVVRAVETLPAREDGRQFTIALSASPITDAAGDVVGVAAIARDITDHNVAVEALHKSELEYRQLFDANPIPMWVFDRETLHFLAVNEAAVRQYGFIRQEFLSMSIADIYPKEDLSELAEDLARRARGLLILNDRRHRRKNGEIIDVEIVCHDLDFHGIDAMLVAAHDVTARKQSEEALLFKNALLEAQSETTVDGILVVDDADRIILANKQFARHFGVSAEMLAQGDDRIVLKFVTEQVENPQAFAEKVSYLNKHRDQKSTEEIRCKNGRVFDRYSAPLVDSNGNYRGRIWYFRDITERKLAESAMQLVKEKYRTIFEDSVLGIFQITPEGRPISINRALARLHGYRSPEELMLEVKNFPEQLFVDPNRMIEVAKIAVRDGVARGLEVEVYCRDRSKKWVRVNQRAVRGMNNDIQHYDGTVEDITERKAAEERIQFLAYYDALTELPHRALLEDRLGSALADAKRNKQKVALLFLDLDRFKIVNDSLGHAFGDIVLKEIAKRLKLCTRAQDTVARVGGDEFLIMLNRVGDVAEAAIAADRVMQAMSTEFVIQGHSVRMSCSIGISIFPEHGVDGETLIKNADAAMYFAKEAGRNDVRFFTSEMDTQAAERLALENSLRIALDKKEFFLVYQPQMEIATGAIIGFEALIRWEHPQLGLVPPTRFIPIAENNGFIQEIGEWVLRTACEQAMQWRNAGLPSVPIAVNVSAVQFRHHSFRALVERVLQETGLPPEYLELELTESLLLSNEDVMFDVLRELREMGVKLAIDDFGTGYSSLSYLKQFRVNKLKIDRSFICNIATDPGDAAITDAIISMARSMNIKVIAEGVEDEEQMSFLREHGCDQIQGYYFSKPIMASEVADKLLSSSRAA